MIVPTQNRRARGKLEPRNKRGVSQHENPPANFSNSLQLLHRSTRYACFRTSVLECGEERSDSPLWPRHRRSRRINQYRLLPYPKRRLRTLHRRCPKSGGASWVASCSFRTCSCSINRDLPPRIQGDCELFQLKLICGCPVLRGGSWEGIPNGCLAPAIVCVLKRCPQAIA